MKIEFNLLDRQYEKYSEEYDDAAIRVLKSGWYILGNELSSFENEFADWVGTKYCVGVNSGLDALVLSIKALNIGPGDEVIVPANTYIATVLGVTLNGATPVFVEPDNFYNINVNKLEQVITQKTKAILAVHLYGQAADINEITIIAKRYNLYLIEDCAQAHGAHLNGKKVGTFGDIGCFSFFPTKNLGAFGDAGAIVTDNENLAEKFKKLRNYGSKIKYSNEIEGVNSRMDELQAALLRIKLKHLSELNNERIRIAGEYLQRIKNDQVILPLIKHETGGHVFHLFVIQSKNRDLLQRYLLGHEIKTQIHYPIPPHLADCYQFLGYKRGDFEITERQSDSILSLPLYNGMRNQEIDYVIDVINSYKG